MLRAALRDLQWRWKRFVIAMVGVALVFAMGLIMTGLSESFSLEVDRTLQAIDADVWAVSDDASGPFTSFVPVLASAAGPGASPVMVLRQTISDAGILADIIVVGVEPGRLGSPRAADGVDLGGPGEAVVDEALEVAGLGDTFSLGGSAFRVVGTVSGQRLYAGLPVVYIPLGDAQAMAVGGQPLATAFLFASAPSSVPAGLKTMSNGDVKSDVLRPLRDAMSSIAFVRLLLVGRRGDDHRVDALSAGDGADTRLRRVQGHRHLDGRDRLGTRPPGGRALARRGRASQQCSPSCSLRCSRCTSRSRRVPSCCSRS